MRILKCLIQSPNTARCCLKLFLEVSLEQLWLTLVHGKNVYCMHVYTLPRVHAYTGFETRFLIVCPLYIYLSVIYGSLRVIESD